MEQKENEIPEWLKILITIGGIILIGYLLAKLFEYLFADDRAKGKMPRVFISHSWQYDDDYRNLVNKFGYYGFEFYNHSIPEEKSISDLNRKNIENDIRNKIKGCTKVLVLAGSYANNYWIRKEIMIATELGKEVIAIRPWGKKSIPTYLKKDASKIVGFNSKSIIEKIKE